MSSIDETTVVRANLGDLLGCPSFKDEKVEENIRALPTWSFHEALDSEALVSEHPIWESDEDRSARIVGVPTDGEETVISMDGQYRAPSGKWVHPKFATFFGLSHCSMFIRFSELEGNLFAQLAIIQALAPKREEVQPFELVLEERDVLDLWGNKTRRSSWVPCTEVDLTCAVLTSFQFLNQGREGGKWALSRVTIPPPAGPEDGRNHDRGLVVHGSSIPLEARCTLTVQYIPQEFKFVGRSVNANSIPCNFDEAEAGEQDEPMQSMRSVRKAQAEV